MAVPWLQLVQLVPSIVEVSRELLKKNRREPVDVDVPQTPVELQNRVATLEENERRQAELISQMADQLANLTQLIVVLRTRILWLTAATAIAAIVAIVALFV
jgi:DNA repair exonuclease SbcCD nuclease subunit